MSEWGRITAEAIWKVKSLETHDGETTKGWKKAIKKIAVSDGGPSPVFSTNYQRWASYL